MLTSGLKCLSVRLVGGLRKRYRNTQSPVHAGVFKPASSPLTWSIKIVIKMENIRPDDRALGSLRLLRKQGQFITTDNLRDFRTTIPRLGVLTIAFVFSVR